MVQYMKKYLKMRISLIISLIIVVGFISVSLINYYTYGKVIKDDIKNISKLTSTNIYSDINNELTKPIFVSLTMANDHFLKDWLSDEQASLNDEAYIKKLQDFLIGIKLKYNYNSVFLVSAQTNNYYHFEGIHKSISKDNEHDQWYYAFIDENEFYDLDVDTDEAADNTLTVFINCRIEDDNGSLMGVVGVGVEMNEVQNILKKFEDNFDLEACLIDHDGLTQVHTHSKFIERVNMFKEPVVNQFRDQIIENKESMETFQYQQEKLDGYLITRYISELDWYLMIKKDTSILKKSFHSQMASDFFIILLVILVLILLSNNLIRRYERQITELIKIDQLTRLPNRRAFEESIQDALEQFNKNEQTFTAFVFDVDNFKKINDTHGHIFGDQVLALIGTLTKKRLGSAAIVTRWGGDEFAGIIYASKEQAEKIGSDLIAYIDSVKELKEYGITISLGLTEVQSLDTPDSLMIRADQGLYEAKKNGKNQSYMI